MMKFTEEEYNELRAAAEEILAVPGAEKKLLEILKRQSPGWRKATGITPPMMKAMEKEIAQTGGSSHNQPRLARIASGPSGLYAQQPSVRNDSRPVLERAENQAIARQRKKAARAETRAAIRLCGGV